MPPGLERDVVATLSGDQASQLRIQVVAALGVDPRAIKRLEMETARACRDPDFARHAVTVDDDLAAVRKLDLEDAVGRRLEIEIGGLDTALDAPQRNVDRLVKFCFVHSLSPCMPASKPC